MHLPFAELSLYTRTLISLLRNLYSGKNVKGVTIR